VVSPYTAFAVAPLTGQLARDYRSWLESQHAFHTSMRWNSGCHSSQLGFCNLLHWTWEFRYLRWKYLCLVVIFISSLFIEAIYYSMLVLISTCHMF